MTVLAGILLPIALFVSGARLAEALLASDVARNLRNCARICLGGLGAAVGGVILAPLASPFTAAEFLAGFGILGGAILLFVSAIACVVGIVDLADRVERVIRTVTVRAPLSDSEA